MPSRWVPEERADGVLVGGVDEFCKVLGYCRHCRWGNGESLTEPAARATDRHAVVDEGACFFVLTGEKQPASAYGCIEDVRMGNFERGGLELPQKASIVLGDDGFSFYDAHCAGLLPDDCQFAVYTPLYGALPFGMAFDVAISALSRKSGVFFPSPTERPPAMKGARSARGGKTDNSHRVGCLKLGAGGAYGQVTLHRH